MSEFLPIEYPIQIPYQLRVYFTKGVFDTANPIFRDLACSRESGNRHKTLFYIDEAVGEANPGLVEQIETYFKHHENDLLLKGIHLLPGGESIKNEPDIVDRIYADIENSRICRHSYIAAIGGGALLDTVGFAAATAHRGIRHFRFPTTTLGQADAGVGVKNGVNFHQKKNFVGTFSPPFAVINDLRFLGTLPEVHMRNGYIEAIKVALIRDSGFFKWIELQVDALNRFDESVLEELVYRCAKHHVAYIATSGDPFEMGSVRPLDFGHWAAHKLEQLSDFKLSHGEAVAIGIAIDTLYSEEMGYLDSTSAQRILNLLQQLKFEIYSDFLEKKNGGRIPSILEGLEEFREHLGGLLTITLLKRIGSRFEVHEVNTDVVLKAIKRLKTL
ncbi:MAG: 3-dehydroquinate synthase [Verrucomicrobia bacterium]|nr:3-dehydroquinate synthase [Verrucomicrobiota bacterium]